MTVRRRVCATMSFVVATVMRLSCSACVVLSTRSSMPSIEWSSEFEECCAGRCQSYGALAPVEQHGTHLLFQFADMCRYRRLTEAELDSGLGDAVCLRRRAEAPQLSQFHEAYTPIHYCEIEYILSHSMPSIDTVVA